MKNTPPSRRWSFSKTSCLLLSVLASGVALSSSAQAASGTWSSATSGNWTNTGNWLGGVEASGAGSIANFNGVDLTANVAVHLDAPRTVGGLTFSDTDTGTLFSYTLDNNGSASNVLTLDTGTATAATIGVATGNTATISLNIAGTTGFTKANTNGTLILTGTNTYSGVTTITGGSVGFVQVNSNAAFGASTLSVSTANGGIRYGAAFNDLRDIAFGANGGRLDTNGFNVTYSSTLSGTIAGGSAFTKTGAGTLILAGTNNISGAGGVIVSGGFLQIDSDARLGSGTGALTLNASSSGIRYGAAFNDLRAISLGNSGGTVDTNGYDVNYSSAISSVGTGTFTKAGVGTLRLTAANTYTGQTVVNAGTLLVNVSTASTANVTVNSTATLGGIGTIAGATTIASGGTLSPGDSVGTLAFASNLTLNNGSTYAFQGGDLVTVAGTLSLVNNWTLSLSGLVDGGSVTIFTFGTLAASPDLVPTFDISQLGFTPTGPLSLSVVGNTVVLNGLQAVPEPGTYALMLVAGGLIFGIRRWHARKVAV